MRGISTSMGAPVALCGSNVNRLGDGFDAYLLVYQKTNSRFCESPLIECTLRLANFSVLWIHPLFPHVLSMDFLSLRQKPNYFYHPSLPHKQQSTFLKPFF